MSKSSKTLFRVAEEACDKDLGISVTQSSALMFIAKNQGCSQKELAETLGLNKSAITGLLNRMEAQALIERRASEVDARASRIYLRERGRTLLPLIKPLITRMNESLTEGFTASEIVTVARFLKHIIENLEDK